MNKSPFSVSSKARSSPSEVSCKRAILRNFAKFTGKHLYQSLFFNKVAGLRPATLLKKRLWHRCKCFSADFAKFLRAPLLQNTSGGCFSKASMVNSYVLWWWQTLFPFLHLCKKFGIDIYSLFCVQICVETWKKCSLVTGVSINFDEDC